jgi:hypothetical protein
MKHSKIYLVWKKVRTIEDGKEVTTNMVLDAFADRDTAIRRINNKLKLRIGMLKKEYDGQFIADGGCLDFVIDTEVSTSQAVTILNTIDNKEVIHYRYYMTETLLWTDDV